MIDNIINDIRETYAIDCHNIIKRDGGYMNELWYANSNVGKLIIKLYDPRRFNLRKLKSIDSALLIQMFLRDMGLECPKIFMRGNRALRFSDARRAYGVMEFRAGENISHSDISLEQLRSLGETCADIHEKLRVARAEAHKYTEIEAAFTLIAQTHKPETLAGARANYQTLNARLTGVENAEYRAALKLQPRILAAFDRDFCEKQPMGFGHEDFTPDNLLFDARGVCAVLDFDRLRYGYAHHDAGRALLSYALHNYTLDRERVRAFRDGYERISPLPNAAIATALRATWLIEAPWWIREEFFTQYRGKATRFKDELKWLTENFFDIDEML